MLDSLDITYQERELLEVEYPEYLKRIERKDPLIKAWLTGWRSRQSIIVYEDANFEIVNGKNAECAAALICHYPTDLTRCSPFFPISTQNLSSRAFLQNVVLAQGSWGEILFSGPKLSIFDEDVLMTVLSVILQKNKFEQSKLENKYIYEGPILPFLNVIYKNTPSKKDYKRFKDSLTRLVSSALELAVSYGDGTQKRKRSINNMISSITIDEKTKFIRIVINPYFYEMYIEGNSTYIDMTKRIKIDSFIGKALYRFLLSQQSKSYKINFLKLASALNMNLTSEKYKIRSQIKKAIIELQDKTILSKKSCFLTQDIVFLLKE